MVTLNALLGLGTALAPVFVAVFVGLGFWWGLPVLSTALLVVLALAANRLPLGIEPPARQRTNGDPGVPGRFWLFAGFAVLYGVCETMNGNWSEHDMTASLGASTTQAALALTAFWGMVTVGRLLFAAVGRWLPRAAVFRSSRSCWSAPSRSPPPSRTRHPPGGSGVRARRAGARPCCR